MEISFTEAKLEAGRLIIDIPLEHRGVAMRWIKGKKNRLYDLAIKEHRNKRSLDANAYAWVLIGHLANAMHITPKEVYLQAIVNIGGNYEIVPIREDAVGKFMESWQKQGIGWPAYDMGQSKTLGYRNIRVYYGSSSYDTRQMAALIDNLTQDCLALGIETKPQEEIDSLLGAWK
jgi:hypothetical protein